jgi:hypothetical protein
LLIAPARGVRGQFRDVLGVLGSRRSDDAGRRIFQPRFYSHQHASTECRVHFEVTGFSVGLAFDFRDALDFVVVAHFGVVPS